jgi:hypothetical protein
VTDGGLKVAVTFGGRPETPKPTAAANPLALLRVTVMGIDADLPVATVTAAGALTVKSLIVKLTARDEPPGLLAVIAGVPPADTSVAGIVAVSCVGLTKVVGSA